MSNLTDTLIQHADFLINARGSVSDAIALLDAATENQKQRAEKWGWNHPSVELGGAVVSSLSELNDATENGWIAPNAPLEFFAPRWRDDILQKLKKFAAHCAQPGSAA